jgi:hypothetical protein
LVNKQSQEKLSHARSKIKSPIESDILDFAKEKTRDNLVKTDEPILPGHRRFCSQYQSLQWNVLDNGFNDEKLDIWASGTKKVRCVINFGKESLFKFFCSTNV